MIELPAAAAVGFPLGGQIIIRRATLNSNKPWKKNSRIFINSGGTDHNQAYILKFKQTMEKKTCKNRRVFIYSTQKTCKNCNSAQGHLFQS